MATENNKEAIDRIGSETPDQRTELLGRLMDAAPEAFTDSGI